MKNLIKALQIFLKYNPDSELPPTHCEHDVMYVYAVHPHEVSPEDLKKLSELHFHAEPEEDCFASYYYGSC